MFDGVFKVFHRFDDVGPITTLFDIESKQYNQTFGTSIHKDEVSSFDNLITCLRQDGIGSRRMLIHGDVLTVYPTDGSNPESYIFIDEIPKNNKLLDRITAEIEAAGIVDMRYTHFRIEDSGLYAVHLLNPILTAVEEVLYDRDCDETERGSEAE